MAEEKFSKNKENLNRVALSPKEETPKRWGRWILDEENLSLFLQIMITMKNDIVYPWCYLIIQRKL